MIVHSLYSKLAVVLLVLFLIVGIIFIIVSTYTTEMYQQEVNQKLNRELARLIVSERLMIKDDRVDQKALGEIFHMLMVINPSIEVYLLDPAGKILAFSADPGKVKRKSVALGPVKQFIEGDSSFPLFGDDPRNPQGKKVFTAAPVPLEGEPEGYLYVILGGETYDSVIQKLQASYIFRLGMWAVITSLVIAGATGLIIFASLTRRLRRLAGAMDAYTDGTAVDALDLPASKDVPSADEIDRLVETFRHMAARIREQVDSVQKADALRRELVANVSHDLRTPLSTLQGYMETLLIKRDQLSPEERKHYIEIAIDHCNRLSHLVADLFELAKLEAKDRQITPEPFNINELIQDVVQKFRLRAEENGVVMRADIGGDLPFVVADIGLIERVLENLIENALNYSPNGGSVIIVPTRKAGEVSISVSDTGPGIPEGELPRIFERFYQPDESRTDRPGHSGLGLAITKQILDLHGATITVESEPDKGATFRFSLPIYHGIS
jgi:two-component system OmpR family sensor kinase